MGRLKTLLLASMLGIFTELFWHTVLLTFEEKRFWLARSPQMLLAKLRAICCKAWWRSYLFLIKMNTFIQVHLLIILCLTQSRSYHPGLSYSPGHQERCYKLLFQVSNKGSHRDRDIYEFLCWGLLATAIRSLNWGVLEIIHKCTSIWNNRICVDLMSLCAF